MVEERALVGSLRFSRLIEKFKDRDYRHSFVVAHTRRFLARQMRKFRGDKSQDAFAAVLGKQQTVVSRLEDPTYGKWTLQSLFDVAEKLDLAVFVRFVDHRTFLKLSDDLSDEASGPLNYEETEERERERAEMGEAAQARDASFKRASTQPPPSEAANQNLPPLKQKFEESRPAA